MAGFSQQIEQYKQVIDADIAAYSEHVRKITQEQYGEYGLLVTDAFLDLLGRGGKRMRGALVMAGYEMCGGQDHQMIVRAATALEMIHAYMLLIDDIQDRSELRRGRPTIHIMLADYHRQHGLLGDAEHAGVSLALNAMLSGGHAAQLLIAGLTVDAELRIKVLGILNQTLIITAHGQTQDIINELRPSVPARDVERTMEWKTANYSILNPLCVGMVLAGAGCEDTDAIRDYALNTGKAFQLTDDIIGIFGSVAQSGKSNLDDIREGKQTLLVGHALRHAGASDKAFLRSCLGNPKLTGADFKRCQQIIKDGGALAHSQAQAQTFVDRALVSLAHPPARWHTPQVTFLRDLAKSLTTRRG